jgi:hypothetical protein
MMELQVLLPAKSCLHRMVAPVGFRPINMVLIMLHLTEQPQLFQFPQLSGYSSPACLAWLDESKHKPLQQHITGDSRQQATLLPDALEDYVDEDYPARVIDAFVDIMDMKALAGRIDAQAQS